MGGDARPGAASWSDRAARAIGRGDRWTAPAIPVGRDEQVGPIVIVRASPIGEQAQRFRTRSAAKTAFQITDGAGADTRAFGQLLLTQSCGQAEPPNEGCEL